MLKVTKFKCEIGRNALSIGNINRETEAEVGNDSLYLLAYDEGTVVSTSNSRHTVFLEDKNRQCCILFLISESIRCLISEEGCHL